MNTDRDELIDAMAAVWFDHRQQDEFWRCSCGFGYGPTAPGRAGFSRHLMAVALDALLAHPVAVLRELESAKCETCGGSGCVEEVPGLDLYECSACGGSGKLGRDGVDKLRGFEQVGWRVVGSKVMWSERPSPNACEPVFVRVSVPEPSEGESDE